MRESWYPAFLVTLEDWLFLAQESPVGTFEIRRPHADGLGLGLGFDGLFDSHVPFLAKLDFGYAMAGDTGLLPGRVWDDGHQTYFEFGEETAMPAIFAGGPGKDETLVNFSVRGRVVVVQQRARRFTLRSGKRTATISKQP